MAAAGPLHRVRTSVFLREQLGSVSRPTVGLFYEYKTCNRYFYYMGRRMKKDSGIVLEF